MHFTLALSAVATLAVAAPTSQHAVRDGANSTITLQQLLQIAPKAGCCKSAPFPDECLAAKKAVDPLNKVFADYKITSAAEQAAIISLQAFESAEYQYNKNHFPEPGRPGQGTRNMQMPNFNLMYAQSISDIKSQLDPVVNGAASDGSTLTDDQKTKILDLLNANDEYSLGSAAWFLTTQCKPDVRSALQKGTDDGWNQYITSCVGTTVTDARKAYWTTAKTALKVT